MKQLIVITRQPSPRIEECELTHLARQPINYESVRVQHRQYRELVEKLGARNINLPAIDDQPDSVFVEDPVVILDELAVLTNMDKPSRRKEPRLIEHTIREFRNVICHITDPGRLEGGDVGRIERTIYVGQSTRTDQEGFRQFREIVAEFDYEAVAVQVQGCLHLKTGCAHLGGRDLLINREWIDPKPFEGLNLIDVHPDEAFSAGTALTIGDELIFPSQYPKTLEILREHGHEPHLLDVSEFAKAEGGPSCMSLRFVV